MNDNKTFLYKHISIDNHDLIVQELQEFVMKKMPEIEKTSEKLNGLFVRTSNVKECLIKSPNLKNWLELTNLNIRVIAIIINYKSPQVRSMDPHVDTQVNDLALNFPVQNCSDCWTSLYKLNTGTYVKNTLPNGVEYTGFSDNSKFEEIDRFVLNSAVLFNVKVPHQVWNPTDNTRISVSLRFDRDPWELI